MDYFMTDKINEVMDELFEVEESRLVRCKDCKHLSQSRYNRSYWNNCSVKPVGNGYKRVKVRFLHACIKFEQKDNG